MQSLCMKIDLSIKVVEKNFEQNFSKCVHDLPQLFDLLESIKPCMSNLSQELLVAFSLGRFTFNDLKLAIRNFIVENFLSEKCLELCWNVGTIWMRNLQQGLEWGFQWYWRISTWPNGCWWTTTWVVIARLDPMLKL